MRKQIHLLVTLFLAAALLSACGPGLEGGPGSEVSGDEARDGLGQDPCLQGSWEMSNAEVNALMAQLATVPGLEIPSGTLQIAFTGEEFAYGSQDLVLRAPIADGYLEAEAVFLHTGKFATTDGMLVTTNVVSNAEALVWRANIGGNVTEMAGPNAVFFPIPGGGPYECSSDLLTIDAVGGNGETVYLIFFRQE